MTVHHECVVSCIGEKAVRRGGESTEVKTSSNIWAIESWVSERGVTSIWVLLLSCLCMHVAVSIRSSRGTRLAWSGLFQNYITWILLLYELAYLPSSSLKLSEIPFTQCLSSIGLPNFSPLNTCPRCPPLKCKLCLGSSMNPRHRRAKLTI